MWKWRLKETGGINVFKWQSKLMGSTDGTSWELAACSEEGRAEGDIVTADVFLKGVMVTISLYLKIWLNFNSIFLLFKHFSNQGTHGKGWLAALGSSTLSLSLGTVSPCTLPRLPCPGSHHLPCPPPVAVSSLSCKEWCWSRRHLGGTTLCWALGLGLLVFILPEAWAASPLLDTSVPSLLFLLLWNLLFASFIFLGKRLN